MNENNSFDLKNEICHFIVPKLSKYIDFVKSGEMISLPNWVKSNEDLLNEKQLVDKWVSILEKIYIPFNYYVNPHFYSDYDFIELQEMREEGLDLFAQYFEHLWD